MTETNHEAALAGGCLCGAIRFRVNAEPVLTAVCHCSQCRRAAGAPLTAWAMFPLDGFALDPWVQLDDDLPRHPELPPLGSE